MAASTVDAHDRVAASPGLLDAVAAVAAFEVVVVLAETRSGPWTAAMAYTIVAAAVVVYGRLRGYSVTGTGPVTTRPLMSWSTAGVLVAVTLWVLSAAIRVGGGWSHPYVPWWANDSVVSISLATLVSVTVVAPIAEELVFRGVLYRALRERFSVAASVTVSTLAFTVGHPTSSVVTALLLGVATAIAYERTKTVWAPIAVHAAANTALLLFALAAHYLGDVPGVVQ